MRSLAPLVTASLLALIAQAATARDGEKWVVSWTGPVQGPYPIGNPSAQPDQKFAFPDPAAGARDQTFRLMVRPDLWGRQARIRLSNAFGKKPVTFDGVPEQDAKRKTLNDFIRTSGTFDGVIDFDKAALDPQTGGLKAEFIPESTTGGAGDKLHPNRTGYLAMGQSIDLALFRPGAVGRAAKAKE